MEAIVLVIHLILVVSLVLIILIQRTSSDGLSGLGGGSSSGNALFSVRGKANVLTRITTFLAIGFLATSLTLAYIATHRTSNSLVDQLDAKRNIKELSPEEKAKISGEFNKPPAPAKPAPAPAPAAPTPEVPLAD